MDDILSFQISPHEKYGLGYAGEPSRKGDANPKASKNKNVEKPEGCANIPNSNRSKERSQNNIGRTYGPRIFDVVKIQVLINIIKESQDISTSEVHQGNPHLPGIKLYFLFVVTLVQILGTWEKIVGLTKNFIKTLEGNLQVDKNEIKIDLTVQ